MDKLVWHLNKQQWIPFKKWMIWCDDINTKGLNNEI